MSERNLHAKAFDEGTKEKLTIYREYLREWLPVFLRTKAHFSKIQIFDFFAGPGSDVNGHPASPVIALEEVHNALELAKNQRVAPSAVDLYFNEFSKTKYNELVRNIQSHPYFVDVNVEFAHKDFSDAFDTWYPLMTRSGVTNFIFLDQNGVKHVSTDIFLKLSSLQHTDYMFYMASSIVNRFKEDPIIVNPLPITKDDLKRMNGTNVHTIVKEAYERLAKGRYLAPFSIRKGANVYGLIFGTEHLLGLEKFLAVCWKQDTVLGLANFDIANENIDSSAPSLFAEMNRPKKLDLFEQDLAQKIRTHTIRTNHMVYEFALRSGFLPVHARNALKSMMDKEDIPKQRIPISRDCIKQPPVIIKTDKEDRK